MRDQNGLPDVLTVDEIARYLRVSRTTVCRWCVQGRGSLPFGLAAAGVCSGGIWSSISSMQGLVVSWHRMIR